MSELLTNAVAFTCEKYCYLIFFRITQKVVGVNEYLIQMRCYLVDKFLVGFVALLE